MSEEFFDNSLCHKELPIVVKNTPEALPKITEFWKSLTCITFSFLACVNTLETIKERDDSLPGNTQLPSSSEELLELASFDKGSFKYSVEDYFGTPKLSSFEISPDGKYLSYREKDDGVTDYQILYRNSEKSKFKEVLTYSWQEHFDILSFHPNKPHHAYVCTNVGKDKSAIVLFDLSKNKFVETLFEHPSFDAEDITLSSERNYEIESYHYTGEKEQIVPVSKPFKAIYEDLQNQFTGYQFEITGKTDNEDKYLVYVSSDRLYGKYYLYDTLIRKSKLLVDLMPTLKENDMAEMKSIKYASRDGFQIYAYLTMPNSMKEGKQVPLIVNPHGGPYGVRDTWGFNSETQLFASRGYATLQINFRGSGGYGKTFYLAGNKQIGRKMLDDLEDGVKYVIENFNVDEERIAIYGASYGGLATLGSLMKTPEIYRCGVDYVGVSNFFTFIESFPAYWKPYMEEFYAQWYDPDIPEEKEIMKQVSPTLNIEKFNKPLFIVQGANDPRVNIHESDQIVEQLRNRGIDVPYMVKYNEGHGFQHEENKIELYKTMLGFFAKHLK